MSDAIESTLVLRLTRLEARVTKIKRAVAVGLVLLAGIWFLGASTAEEPASSLEAHAFVLRDSDGCERGLLTVRDDLAVLVLKDDAGNVTAELGGHSRVFPVGQ